MNFDMFDSDTLNAMTSYMGRLSQRQQIVASNLANIDTPGYKTKEISFHAEMEEMLDLPGEELRTTEPRHIHSQTTSLPQFEPHEEKGLIERVDGNNVDIDREMMKLSKTSFGYSMITELLRGKFSTLSLSINEGNS